MRSDCQHNGKDNKEKRQNKQSVKCWIQPCERTECDRNAFAAVKPIMQRKDMADYRRRNDERSKKWVGLIRSSVTHKQKNRNKSFQYVEDQRKNTAPKSAVYESICSPRIMIDALLKYFLFKYSCKYAGIQDTAGEISYANKNCRFKHLYHLVEPYKLV